MAERELTACVPHDEPVRLQISVTKPDGSPVFEIDFGVELPGDHCPGISAFMRAMAGEPTVTFHMMPTAQGPGS